MELPMKLYNEIVDFLKLLPNVHDSDSQRALIYQAGLDIQLQDVNGYMADLTLLGQNLMRITGMARKMSMEYLPYWRIIHLPMKVVQRTKPFVRTQL